MSDVRFTKPDLSDAMERLRQSELKAVRRQAEISDARAGLAHTMFEPLIQAIKEFQAELAADQEVGLWSCSSESPAQAHASPSTFSLGRGAAV